ncbi:hypothetical protein GCM10007901_41120 [Dyella acidisoli]|uniref:Uncharacterized protein n=1 Tax=Dyella acidisoli TaxID=1867834 RepID=A0ABQ5XUY8_9GAMM|nr:hypothetical protein GCM10007901_41120 [Dyella acidisoli]
MNPMILDLTPANADQDPEIRRVSAEPVEGYVLEPWSGLYVETEPAYRSRLATANVEA